MTKTYKIKLLLTQNDNSDGGITTTRDLESEVITEET